MLIIIFATLAPMLLDTKWGDHKKEVFKLSIGDLNAWLKLINLAVNLWDAVNDRNFYSSLMKLSSSLCLWDDASSSTLRKLMLANYLLGKKPGCWEIVWITVGMKKFAKEALWYVLTLLWHAECFRIVLGLLFCILAELTCFGNFWSKNFDFTILCLLHKRSNDSCASFLM